MTKLKIILYLHWLKTSIICLFHQIYFVKLNVFKVGDYVDIKKSMIIDEMSKEFVYVMLRDDYKSEILKLYNQSNDTMENCARRYLENKLRELN